jgi:resuscitation-promoting factor RpfB
MKLFLQKFHKWLFPGAFLMILVGIGLIWFGLMQTNTIIIAGEPVSVRTNALRASGVLRAADIIVGEDDRLVPAGDPWIWQPAVITIEPARDVMIKTPDGQVTLRTAERIPANLVSQVDVPLFPNDRVLFNGQAIDPNVPLEDEKDFALLQVQPAVPVNLVIDGRQLTVYSGQPTLGAALEAAAIRVAPQDWISEDLLTPLEDDLAVTIRRARPVRVMVGEMELAGMTAAVTVGDALVDIGVTLQNLDYTEPPEDVPIPPDGEIELVQVSEQVLILTDEVPYANEYVEDPNTELDQVSVVQPGQVGIFATRERLQYANGEELWRDTPVSWQASEAADGLLGYGSRVEVRTAVVDGQEIEYWRKISVYATSYSPCRLGVPGLCSNITASGLPVSKGTIAVTRNWFNMMKFQQVFVQGYGYGTIADIGGGGLYFNHYWIDLGYPDDSYQSWHHWTTMYFLTPVPAWYPAVLPWP